MSRTSWIPDVAATLVRRLRAVDAENPVVDDGGAARVLSDHVGALGYRSLPVRWAGDPSAAEDRLMGLSAREANSAWYSRERDVYHQIQGKLAAGSATEVRAWEAINRAILRTPHAVAHLPLFALRRVAGVPPRLFYVWWGVRLSAQLEGCFSSDRWLTDRFRPVLQPMIDLYEAGVWAFGLGSNEVVAVPAPQLLIDRNRLHGPNRPAVLWASGAGRYFWRGVEVPDFVILRPAEITALKILGEDNAEVRRVMLDVFGRERFISELRATPIQRDEFGTLYRIHLRGDEPLVMVEVVNSTPEHDGSFRKYLLRVPPTVTTAHEAVAWTFGMPKDTYGPRLAT